MKRIEELDGAIVEREITVTDYIAKAQAVPSPNWVSKDELGTTRMFAYVLAFLVVLVAFGPPLVRALGR